MRTSTLSIRSALTKGTDAFDRWFFRKVDPRPLAVARILLGAEVLANLLSLVPDRESWFADTGILSTSSRFSRLDPWALNIFRWLPNDVNTISLALGVAVFAAIFFTAGLRTRWSGLLLWILLTSFQHQNLLILQGGDLLMRNALFLLTLTPCGIVFSADAWLSGRKKAPLWSRGKEVPAYALKFLQAQIAILYLGTFIWKIRSTEWLDGSAIYFTSRLLDFQRFTTPYVFDHLWTIQLLSWTTLSIELALGVLIWFSRTRNYAICAALVFHLALEVSMNIPIFQWSAIACLFALVDTKTLPRFWKTA